MLAVAHEARLNAVDQDGVSRRATLEASAAHGNRYAIEALTPPENSGMVDYLREWAGELVGRSGVGMDGFAPLSWDTIDAWARRTGRNPTPDECAALMALDAVMRHPGEPDAEKPADGEVKPLVVAAWPQKKEVTE